MAWAIQLGEMVGVVPREGDYPDVLAYRRAHEVAEWIKSELADADILEAGADWIRYQQAGAEHRLAARHGQLQRDEQKVQSLGHGGSVRFLPRDAQRLHLEITYCGTEMCHTVELTIRTRTS